MAVRSAFAHGGCGVRWRRAVPACGARAARRCRRGTRAGRRCHAEVVGDARRGTRQPSRWRSCGRCWRSTKAAWRSSSGRWVRSSRNRRALRLVPKSATRSAASPPRNSCSACSGGLPRDGRSIGGHSGALHSTPPCWRPTCAWTVRVVPCSRGRGSSGRWRSATGRRPIASCARRRRSPGHRSISPGCAINCSAPIRLGGRGCTTPRSTPRAWRRTSGRRTQAPPWRRCARPSGSLR